MENKGVWQLYLFPDHTLSVPGPASLGEVVDRSEFNECREDKGIADSDEPVHGCSISHFRQRVSSTDAESCHSEHCGHTWWEGKLGQFL